MMGSTAARGFYCHGVRATRVGTSGDDTLFLRQGDVAVTRRGNDVVVSTGGALVCTNGGRDTIYAVSEEEQFRRRGNNVFDGGPGRDLVDYEKFQFKVEVNLLTGRAVGPGTDEIFKIEDVGGGDGDDVIIGNDESNVLGGGRKGRDHLWGAAGDDVLVPEDPESSGDTQDNDVVDGGSGEDWLVVTNVDPSSTEGSDKGTTVDLEQGTAATGETVDSIIRIENVKAGGCADDIFLGDGYSNRFDGGAGSDQIQGRGGDDILDGGTEINGTGYDELDGGDGMDVCTNGESLDACESGTAGSVDLQPCFIDGRHQSRSQVPVSD